MNLKHLPLFLACLPLSAAAAPGDAAFLFAYRPGDNAAFDAGYREHLQWHRERQDPLPWYGWYVVSGERTGQFVDGSFGLQFAEYDRRAAPAEDGAHFQKHVAPHGETAWRQVLRLKRALSTAPLLEQGKPSAQLDVLEVRIRPGQSGRFETLLKDLLRASARKPALAVYETLSGGHVPSYLMMLPRQAFADFDETASSLDGLIRQYADGAERERLLQSLASSVTDSRVETWQYRADLSNLPD